MKTFFASAERSAPEKLRGQLRQVSQSPVMDQVLRSVGGIIAVLNRDCQILAVNLEFARRLGLQFTEEVLGLRPGESIRCVHADDLAGGCGTTRFCRTCGIAISIYVIGSKGPVAATLEMSGFNQSVFMQDSYSPE